MLWEITDLPRLLRQHLLNEFRYQHRWELPPKDTHYLLFRAYVLRFDFPSLYELACAFTIHFKMFRTPSESDVWSLLGGKNAVVTDARDSIVGMTDLSKNASFENDMAYTMYHCCPFCVWCWYCNWRLRLWFPRDWLSINKQEVCLDASSASLSWPQSASKYQTSVLMPLFVLF